MLLKEKVALITGAGRGWGRSIAIAYARQGASVIAVARTKSELDQTAEIIRQEGGNVTKFAFDISEENAIKEIFQYISDHFSQLDILINNAAVLMLKPFTDLSLDEIDQIIKINLRSQIVLCKMAIPQMIKQGGGSIINVSSGAGVKGFEKESIYCATKHAIEGFSKSIALELMPYNIAVNTITPGGKSQNIQIKPTSLTQSEFELLSAEEKSKWTDSIVSTDAFVFLGMQRADGITGQRILAYEFSQHLHECAWQLGLADLRDGLYETGKW